MSGIGRFISNWRQYRAFKRLPGEKRKIVVFSESAQDWCHHASVIDELTGRLGRSICYVASDSTDPGLHQDNPAIHPFCIGNGFFRIVFFQTLQADVMVTQLLDLDNKDLKRSVHPVHYVYMFHSLISTHMADHENSFDHYDTILCAGPHHAEEIRRREVLRELPAKRLVPHGYFRLEQLLAERRDAPPLGDPVNIHVLLAPSWGEQTILNLFGLELTGILLAAGYTLTLRPHFQTRWMTPEVIDAIIDRYGKHPKFRLIEQMGESDSLYDSHVMITDWSGAGMDYGLGLEKPVLYIDVPPKSRNDTWQELGLEPLEMSVRAKIGAVVAPQDLASIPDEINRLLRNPDQIHRQIAAVREASVFNLGSSAAAAAEAIIAIADELVDEKPGA
ncbi:MAG: CDP-glycerol--glycerophosphate glycerophosphotransferase [Gammaproteobacteria bacterium]|nr:CDP-glycerol--glycerophosphate glycerophosphotransferase [Gammaproteobacteria bacterium]MDP7154057.1 CDP-glycerol--glycerophosphate glycerophosphotransferase [Gammaproteobacteria bacterium]MDP7296143.1 CDP-glycerol--glycerophosphate glycerophosphotransferase [Gammaproteobacteria bacterium]MDP7418248.1 CDP-glycerol--glycerophosphate glycerophosphotransferase [Gammaproteobacteria bacterium]MDP7660233.1 CDP-glycerol--glycerophosphate glycerophosphotransferase [Gammaproteobacteria bacterium]